MTIFNEQPEFTPWTRWQQAEAKRMIYDFMDMCDGHGLDAEEQVKYHKEQTNGMDYDKWCHGLGLKYDRIDKQHRRNK